MIINKLGDQYSRLPTRWCERIQPVHVFASYPCSNWIDTITFCTFDIVSLAVQAYGGGLASSANDPNGANFVGFCSTPRQKNVDRSLRAPILCLGESLSNCVRRFMESIKLLIIDRNKYTVSLVVYVICAAEFFLRFLANRPIRETLTIRTFKGQPRYLMDVRMKIMISALMFSTTCLFVRCVDLSST